MHILVTGAAGFIGSHLVERLLGNSWHVVGIDNFNSFYSPAIKRKNIERALTHPNFTLLEGDISDSSFLSSVFEKPFDAVVHLAAMAGVRPSIDDPEHYIQVNIMGTQTLLGHVHRAGIGKFIFASSSSVYGNREKIPFCESDNVLAAVSPYAATKIAGEALCHTYHHLYGLGVHCLRFFTVFGPRQRPEMAIHRFALKIMQGEALTVYGNGESARDYTYVDDVVDGVVASIEQCQGFETINLGGSHTISLNALIELLSRRLNSTANIGRAPECRGDVSITCADITKAKELLGYSPKISIEEGLDRFCNWMEKKGRS